MKLSLEGVALTPKNVHINPQISGDGATLFI